MKVKSLIVSLVLIVCFAGIGIGLYCAWPAITGTITDSKYYTGEDLQEAYDKGFEDAFKNKDELTQQVDYYKELTDTYYTSILDYQSQIKDYETLTENNKNTIFTLEQNKIELQTQVNNLTTIKNSNEETISDLQFEVSNLENQVKILTNSDNGKTEEIAELNKQITSLNNLISQLQNTNTLNVNTIASLNSQIESLNSQISNMTLQNQNASSQITALNNKISELQESINYYEQYIANLENGEQVVATFEFDGSVYNIQIVNKNSIVTVTTPTSTDYVIFNYWTVNGEQVDLSTYQITSNIKFVANVTYKYDVKFMVDNEEYESQIVVKDGYAVLPEEPVKAGYEFDGWSLNGVDIVENISSTAVTQNVTYKAVFTKLHTVTFMYEDEVKSTQQVRNGEYATDVEVENTTYKVFNGWKVNGSFVDIESYKVNADTIFVADIAYSYDVKFIADSLTINSQVVANNSYATIPEPQTKSGYIFDGWTLNGNDVIDISTYQITENTTFIAKYTWYDFSGYYYMSIFDFQGVDLFMSFKVNYHLEYNVSELVVLVDLKNDVSEYFDINYSNDVFDSFTIKSSQVGYFDFLFDYSMKNFKLVYLMGSDSSDNPVYDSNDFDSVIKISKDQFSEEVGYYQLNFNISGRKVNANVLIKQSPILCKDGNFAHYFDSIEMDNISNINCGKIDSSNFFQINFVEKYNNNYYLYLIILSPEILKTGVVPFDNVVVLECDSSGNVLNETNQFRSLDIIEI